MKLSSERILAIGVCLYCLTYAFEGAVRYGLNLLGMDALIFVRDAVLLVPLAALAAKQTLQRSLHPAFIIYLGIVLLHGTVFYLNFGLLPPALLGAKVLLAMLAGAVSSSTLMRPTPGIVRLFLVLWLVTFSGIALDKLGVVTMPWVGMRTVIGDVEVDIGRDWDMEQDSSSYRAGGLTRSSIHAANISPLIALLLMFHLRLWWQQLLVGVMTLPLVYWTTQKGSIVAFAVTWLIVTVFRSRSTIPLRLTFLLFLLACVLLPVILPGYYMETASAGGFSSASFNMRVESMWPQAWTWIDRKGVFPFGVGLGGIGGGQQLFARDYINAADNLFVFLYAYFGVMALVYLGMILWSYLRTSAIDKSNRQALSVLLFIIIYGCVLSMMEDQMTSLFTGAAIGWIAYGRNRAVESWMTQAAPKTKKLPRWRIGTVKAARPPPGSDVEQLPAPETPSQSPDVSPR